MTQRLKRKVETSKVESLAEVWEAITAEEEAITEEEEAITAEE
jgi:hypothetical protein